MPRILARFFNSFGIDLAYMLQNGLWAMLNNFSGIALSFLLSFTLARMTNPSFLGRYSFLMSLLGVMALFSLPGLNLAVIKSISAGATSAFFRAVKISFYSSLIGSVVFAGLSLRYFLAHDHEMGWILALFSLFFPFCYATNTWKAYYEGKRDFSTSNRNNIIVNLISTAAIILPILYRQNLIFIFTAYLLVQSIAHYIYYRKASISIERNTNDSQLDVLFGVKVSIQRFAQGLINNMPVLVIGILFGYREVAFFAIAQNILNIITSTVTAFVNIYTPHFFTLQQFGHGEKKLLYALLLTGIASITPFILITKYMIPIIYGESYAISYQIIAGAAPLLIIIPANIILLQFLTTKGYNITLSFAQGTLHLLGVGIVFLIKQTHVLPPEHEYYFVLIAIAYLYALNIGTSFIVYRTYSRYRRELLVASSRA